MNNPVTVITGARTGIGRATALAFAKNGARLVVSGRRETEGRALEVELQKLGAEAVFVQADVRHDEEVRRLIDQAVARFGRLGKPEEIANTILFVAADAASLYYRGGLLREWGYIRWLMPPLTRSTLNQTPGATT
jgi:NAD(P)-dependent dehydrogenase (short-subunit alcohol dehydrogenase family)